MNFQQTLNPISFIGNKNMQTETHRVWSHEAIDQLSKAESIHLINSITGIKPANLIATQNLQGESNLAIFSSVVHLGSRPPLIGCILRPSLNGNRDTYENIKQTGLYSINAVSQDATDKAHYTSAKFAKEVCEFSESGFQRQFYPDFDAPFVADAPIQIGLRLEDELLIQANNTRLLVGKVEFIAVQQNGLDNNLQLNLQQLGVAGISGLNRYYSFNQTAEYQIARVNQFPENQLVT